MTLAKDHYWACHKAAVNSTGYGTGRGIEDEPSLTLVACRDRVEVIGEVTDAEADYSYNNYCLVHLDNKYYLLNTSGCSCPSPTETWGISFGPCSFREMTRHIKEGGFYNATNRQQDEFLAMLDNAKAWIAGGKIPGAA